MPNPVRPEDALPDSESFKIVRGIRVRKGTIFAAMENMRILQTGTEAEKAAAMDVIRELAPGLVALGVHDNFQCRNQEVESLLTAVAVDLGI
jgi:hypothetical protein